MIHPVKPDQLPDGMVYEQIARYAASAIILNDQNQVLLMLRDDVPLWAGIGGGVEAGESFQIALHREVKEETGLTVDIVKEGTIYFSPLTPDAKQFYCVKTHLCKANPADAVPMLQDEGIKLDWFDLDRLPYNFSPTNRLRLTEALQGSTALTRILPYMPNMKEFSRSLKTEDMYVFDFWRSHPNVVRKNSISAL